MAIIEPDPERFLAAASEFLYVMGLMEKLDDDLESIVAKNIEWRDIFIVSNRVLANDVLANIWSGCS